MDEKLHSRVTSLSPTDLDLELRSLTLRLEQSLPLSEGQHKQDPAFVPSLPFVWDQGLPPAPW